MLILKHLKMLKRVSIFIQIILRELVVSSLKSLSLKLLKIIKNVKGPLWQCGSISLTAVAHHCCSGRIPGDHVVLRMKEWTKIQWMNWCTAVQLRSPHRMPCKHTKCMLPHCHNGPFTFLVILNSVTLTRKLQAP
jgi:hypothetical protein